MPRRDERATGRLDPRTRFFAVLTAMLGLGFGGRVAYVLAQPAHDPDFARPMLDAAYYLDWASSLAGGGGGPEGAFYLAPLYPYALAGFLTVAGTDLTWLFLLQQLVSVATGGILGLATRRLTGSGFAGLAAAGLWLTYHPALFFASAPLGETLAILLMATALFATSRSGGRAAALGGALAGLSALARPNLLLLPLWWCVSRARRAPREAALLAAGLVAVLLPVTARNLVVSGHFVPVSANAGITLYHGNGPGALGIFTAPAELSGDVREQRQEAGIIASRAAGHELDAVEADRWWGRRAVAARWADPPGTLRLLGRKLALLVTNRELSLDYAPHLDANPWRWIAPLPFALLLGLSAAGMALAGFRGAGGAIAWGAVLACAVSPVVFYVSSRYRLPLAAVLCVPAGAGIAALGSPHARRLRGALLAVAVTALSLVLPSEDVAAPSEAAALANRGVSHHRAGDLKRAERDLRAAVARFEESLPGWFNLGVVLEARERPEQAEQAYRRALSLEAGSAEAAGNLAGLLIRAGRPSEAVPVLERALAVRPGNRVCHVNLVVALAAAGRNDLARSAARRALEYGVPLEPALLGQIGMPPGSEPE